VSVILHAAKNGQFAQKSKCLGKNGTAAFSHCRASEAVANERVKAERSHRIESQNERLASTRSCGGA